MKKIFLQKQEDMGEELYDAWMELWKAVKDKALQGCAQATQLICGEYELAQTTGLLRMALQSDLAASQQRCHAIAWRRVASGEVDGLDISPAGKISISIDHRGIGISMETDD